MHRGRPPDTGVVNQNIDLTEFSHDRLHHGLNIGVFGDIRGNTNHVAPGCCMDSRRYGVEVSLRPADDRNISPRLSQGIGHLFPKALTAASDDGRFSGKIKIWKCHRNPRS